MTKAPSFLALLALAAAIAIAPSALGQTMVPNGSIGTSHWTAAGSPYLVDGQLTVIPNATLTIDPGVTAQFNGGGLSVQGTLLAIGTAAEPITLTDTANTPGAWNGVEIVGTSTQSNTGSQLAFVTISYAGYQGGDLELSYASATVVNSSFTYSSNSGIHCFVGGNVDVSSSSFRHNTTYALTFEDPTLQPTLQTLTATANGSDRIAIAQGTSAGVRTFNNVLPYDFAGQFIVPPGAQINFGPGVTANFDNRLTVQGTINALGTPTEPITITSLNATPSAWDGITIEGTAMQVNAGSRLEYVTIRYGGYDGGNLNLTYASVSIVGSSFENSGADGIHGFVGGVADIRSSSFSNNTRFALNFEDSSVAPTLSGLTASGNGADRIAIGGGSTSGTRRLTNELEYELMGTVTVPAGAELILDPGVTINIDDGFEVQGTITAIGTSTLPITLTSLTHSPAAWNGLDIVGTSSTPTMNSRLDHLNVMYGGYKGGNVIIGYGAVKITNSQISNSGADGILALQGGAIAVDNVHFEGNNRYAIHLEDPSLASTFSNLTAMNNTVGDSIAYEGGTIQGTRLFNTALTYEFLGDIIVPRGSLISFGPGVTVVPHEGLVVSGTILAIGTTANPIKFTGPAQTPSSWNGITIQGTSDAFNAGSRFENVTFEYGGYRGGNLILSSASVHVSTCVFQNSGSNDIDADNAGGSLIEQSALLSPGSSDAYGIRHAVGMNGLPIYAANNWWGSASGPLAGDMCGLMGSGSRVSADVVYLPFLMASPIDLGPVPSIAGFSATLTPLRWYVPADGNAQAYVKIALRDSNGMPVQGRKITIGSTLGTVTGGGMTDITGTVFAYVTSTSSGTATITTLVQDLGLCEQIRGALTTITFTSIDDNPLMPDTESPYMTDDIEISPYPVVEGVPTTISAKLRNDNMTPISVDADFGFAQLGLGLTFGPIGQVTKQMIPASSTGTVSVVWTPNVSGHYCFQVHYNSSPVIGSSGGGLRTAGQGLGGGGSSQRNVDVRPSNLRNYPQQNAMQQTGDALGAFSKFTSALGFLVGRATGSSTPFGVPMAVAQQGIKWDLNNANAISRALNGQSTANSQQSYTGRKSSALLGDDPAAYRQVPHVDHIALSPITTSDGVSQAHADAFNAWVRKSTDAISSFKAMYLADLRDTEASNASDLEWASQQAAAYNFFTAQTGQGFVDAAGATDALLQLLQSEGTTSAPVTIAEWTDYQAQLRANGFSADDLQAAHLFGYSDADIEQYRQDLLNTAPADLAGDQLDVLRNMSAAFRVLGQALLLPPSIEIAPQQIGSALAPAQGILARVYNTSSTFTVGNPLSETTTISLLVRPVDLPSDWSVVLTPPALALAANASAKIVATIVPGSSVVQGTRPRVAIEGYAKGQLIGGVVIDTLVPRYVAFGADCAGTGAKSGGDACSCSADCPASYLCEALPGATDRHCVQSCVTTAASPCSSATDGCMRLSGTTGFCVAGASMMVNMPPPKNPVPKKTGCSCSAAHDTRSPTSGLALLVVLAALALLRRHRVRAIVSRRIF